MIQRRTLAIAPLLCAAIATLAAIAPAQAQTFPTKPMTIVVPASPGGAIDLAARLIGQKMSESWGQPVVIDNRTGATGIIGTDFVAKSPPDGHTLALVASSHAINPLMVKKLPFDTLKSFEPVVQTHAVPLVLVVAPSFPAKNLKELIAYGKAHPGQLSFASSGSGGAPHFSGELFKSMTGIDMVHVPYKGSTLAHPDLLSGRVSLMFDTLAAVSTQVKAGKLRALAVTTSKRVAMLPDVPTMAEAGLPGYETSTWGGLLAPAGTPKPVVAKIAAETTRILALPDVKQRLMDAGVEPVGGTPEQFSAFIAQEMGKWAKVAKDAGIQPE
ncbi:tripartite tricarboxylate transporter substrate binding protein [Variovorax sp. Sphag1AA]|uniref:tripartite tricarboxylate transporter substrate binding protein n=1 Tax=Variovorax sp. Sphag1AA TaxID=2587027 RepID=UPI0016158985|nr:tripartite tricarboxylate transporter substrate binding protein [Variovorax sp. Sphag1AA]MBB3178573.1 tripartite-type tricarboxylate transporter receptor subunit TctC [Variovorax sp. Sphag1AA]